MQNFETAQNNFLAQEASYSEYATKSSSAIRLTSEESDIRTSFFRDADRIIHSLSYNRYADTR